MYDNSLYEDRSKRRKIDYDINNDNNNNNNSNAFSNVSSSNGGNGNGSQYYRGGSSSSSSSSNLNENNNSRPPTMMMMNRVSHHHHHGHHHNHPNHHHHHQYHHPHHHQHYQPPPPPSYENNGGGNNGSGSQSYYNNNGNTLVNGGSGGNRNGRDHQLYYNNNNNNNNSRHSNNALNNNNGRDYEQYHDGELVVQQGGASRRRTSMRVSPPAASSIKQPPPPPRQHPYPSHTHNRAASRTPTPPPPTATTTTTTTTKEETDSNFSAEKGEEEIVKSNDSIAISSPQHTSTEPKSDLTEQSKSLFQHESQLQQQQSEEEVKKLSNQESTDAFERSPVETPNNSVPTNSQVEEPILNGDNLTSSSSGLSQKEVLKAIKDVDEAISNLSEQLHAIKSKPLPTAQQQPLEQHASPITNKNVIQKLYFENRQKSMESAKIFYQLVPNSMLSNDESMSAPLKNTDFSQFCDSNTHNNSALLEELEKSILSKWEQLHSKNLLLVEEYRRLKQDYQEKLKKRKKRLLQKSGDDDKDEEFEEEDYKPMTRHKKTLAVIPPMLTEEEKAYAFVSNNGYVDSETVLREYQEQRHYETSWTDEEKKIFMQKFLSYPKNCKKIATFLPNKTTYDCVNFYYNNKLTPEFKKLKEDLRGKRRYKKRVYDEGPGSRSKPRTEVDEEPTQEEKSSTKEKVNKKQKTAEEWSDNEISTMIALLQEYGKNFTQIAQRLKSKTAAQCKNYFNANSSRLNLESYVRTTTRSGRSTGTVVPKQSTQNRRRESVVKDSQATPRIAPATPKDQQSTKQQSVQPQKPDSPKKTKKQVSVWTISEKDNFLDLFLEYGRNWKKLAELIPTKTESQIKNFYQNYKIKLGLAEPLGSKIKKKKKRMSILFDPTPVDLCRLAEVAQHITDVGAVDLKLLAESSSEELQEEEDEDLTSIAPPPPPSLLNINPNAEMSYRMNHQANFLAGSSDKRSSTSSMTGVDLLASMALQETTAPSQCAYPPPLPQTSYPSLQDVLMSSPSVQQQTPIQATPAPEPAPKPAPITKKTRTNTRRKSNAGSTTAGAAVTSRSKKSPQQDPKNQHVAPDVLQNSFSLYGFPNLTLPPFSPLQTTHLNVGSNTGYNPMSIDTSQSLGPTNLPSAVPPVSTSITTTGDNSQQRTTPTKLNQPQVQTHSQPQPTQAQPQPWFWLGQQAPHGNSSAETSTPPNNDMNSFKPNNVKSSIDLTSTETLSGTTFAPQFNSNTHLSNNSYTNKDQAFSRHQPTTNPLSSSNVSPNTSSSNTVVPSNLPPFHAFSTVLSQLPPLLPGNSPNPGTVEKSHTASPPKTENKSVIEQLAPQHTQQYGNAFSFTLQKSTPAASHPVISDNSTHHNTTGNTQDKVSIQDLEQGKIPDFFSGLSTASHSNTNSTSQTQWNSGLSTNAVSQTTDYNQTHKQQHQGIQSAFSQQPFSNPSLFPSNSISTTPSVGNAFNTDATRYSSPTAPNAFSILSLNNNTTQNQPVPVTTAHTAVNPSPAPDHQALFLMLQQTPPLGGESSHNSISHQQHNIRLQSTPQQQGVSPTLFGIQPAPAPPVQIPANNSRSATPMATSISDFTSIFSNPVTTGTTSTTSPFILGSNTHVQNENKK